MLGCLKRLFVYFAPFDEPGQDVMTGVPWTECHEILSMLNIGNPVKKTLVASATGVWQIVSIELDQWQSDDSNMRECGVILCINWLAGFHTYFMHQSYAPTIFNHDVGSDAQEMPVVGYMQELALQPLISHKALKWDHVFVVFFGEAFPLPTVVLQEIVYVFHNMINCNAKCIKMYNGVICGDIYYDMIWKDTS